MLGWGQENTWLKNSNFTKINIDLTVPNLNMCIINNRIISTGYTSPRALVYLLLHIVHSIGLQFVTCHTIGYIDEKKCNIASSNPNWFEIIGLCIIRNNHIGGMKMLQFQSNFFIANHFHLLPAKIITLLMTSIIHFDTANNFAWVLTIACQ